MDIFQKLINAAKNKLDQEKLGKFKIEDKNYRKFLENLTNKKCPACGQKLELLKAVVKKQNDVETISYEFICGHKHSEISISETIKINEKIKGKIREENKKPHVTFLSKTEPGKNPKSVDGVSISWSADRKKNEWDHVIKDIRTGKILHEEHVPLDKHKK